MVSTTPLIATALVTWDGEADKRNVRYEYAGVDLQLQDTIVAPDGIR